MWHLTCDTWHVTRDTWHMTHDTHPNPPTHTPKPYIWGDVKKTSPMEEDVFFTGDRHAHIRTSRLYHWIGPVGRFSENWEFWKLGLLLGLLCFVCEQLFLIASLGVGIVWFLSRPPSLPDVRYLSDRQHANHLTKLIPRSWPGQSPTFGREKI